MNETLNRYIELIFRKKNLVALYEEMVNFTKNNLMQTLYECFDKDTKEKANMEIVIIRRWIKEIEDEMESLEPGLEKEYFEDFGKRLMEKRKEMLA